MNVSLFLTGVIMFAAGIIANNLQATIFMTLVGLGFMAAGLGEDACEDLYDTLKSMFEDLIPFSQGL